VTVSSRWAYRAYPRAIAFSSYREVSIQRVTVSSRWAYRAYPKAIAFSSYREVSIQRVTVSSRWAYRAYSRAIAFPTISAQHLVLLSHCTFELGPENGVIGGRRWDRWAPPQQPTFFPTGTFLGLEGKYRQQGHGTALQSFSVHTSKTDSPTALHTSVIFKVGTPHPVGFRPGGICSRCHGKCSKLYGVATAK